MISGAKSLTVVPNLPHYLGKTCLWIRSGAGPQIGFGHLKRSIVLAKSLLDCTRPLFLVEPHDKWSPHLLKSEGMAFVSEDLDAIWSLLPVPGAILIDTPMPEGLDRLIGYARNRRIPVISIHDLGRNPIASDIAIDGSIAPFVLESASEPIRIYSGTKYMVLDPVYGIHHRRRRHVRVKIQSILVNLGGGNSRGYFWKVMEGLRLWNHGIDVIGVPGFVSWGQEDLARKDWRPLRFHWEDTSIDALLFQADLAITAGGLAAYEALCTGTPLLALAYDPLQRTTIASIAKAGACIDLGSGDDLDPDRLPEVLSRLESETRKRNVLSIKGRSIVDGGGAKRVSQIIRGLIHRRCAVNCLNVMG